MRLAFNAGIKIRFKVKKCVSQSFQAIISRVGNDFNRSTVQLQRCKPCLDQIHRIVHSIIKQRPCSISTLQFIDLVLQSLSPTNTNQFTEVLPRSWKISIARVFPISIVDRGFFSAEVHSYFFISWALPIFQLSRIHRNFLPRYNTHSHFPHFRCRLFSLQYQKQPGKSKGIEFHSEYICTHLRHRNCTSFTHRLIFKPQFHWSGQPHNISWWIETRGRQQ